MSLLGYLQDKGKSCGASQFPKEIPLTNQLKLSKVVLAAILKKSLVQQFRFGSSTRGTILPRSMDEKSHRLYGCP